MRNRPGLPVPSGPVHGNGSAVHWRQLHHPHPEHRLQHPGFDGDLRTGHRASGGVIFYAFPEIPMSFLPLDALIAALLDGD
jgi:hypothetical protein